MPLFRICDGQLMPNRADLQSFDGVCTAFGYADPNELSGDDVVVLVSEAKPPLRGVPKEAIVRTAVVADPTEDLYLFWVIDDDDEGREAIVAYDTALAGGGHRQVWWKIGFDAWVQLYDVDDCPLIRAFRDIEDARAYVHTDGVIFIPTDVEGWHGAIVHGANLHNSELVTGGDPRIRRAAGIPDGLDLKSPFKARSLEGDYLCMSHLVAKGGIVVPEIMSESPIARVIATSDGGIFLVVRVYDGENGYQVLGRQFTHEEAKQLSL